MSAITDADMRLFFKRVDAMLAASIAGFRKAVRPMARGYQIEAIRKAPVPNCRARRFS